MFRAYRFEHPTTEETESIDRWSYVLAGLFGPIYIFWRGFGSSFLHALLITAGLTLVIVGTVGVTSFLPVSTQFVAIIVVIPAALMTQSVIMISIIKRGYRRRGWLIQAA